jgi:nucleotide-binding universal stress UspA family protein
MQRMLVAVDDSDAAQRAAKLCADLASRLSATLTLVYAVQPPPVVGDPALMDLAALEAADTEFGQKLLDRIAASLNRPGLKLSTQVVHGPAPEAINRAAEKMNADLVAVGSRGRNALARAILGSVSHALVQTSKKPVLVVH